MNKNDLILPVYIDEKALLDLVASIEDGFSTVAKVLNRTSSDTGIDKSIEGGAGVSGVLSGLLGLNLKAVKSETSANQDEKEIAAERYHTNGSLFFKLRQFLVEQGIVKKATDEAIDFSKIDTSDFIEITGSLKPNPFVASLESIDRLVDIYEAALKFNTQPDNSQPTKKVKRPIQNSEGKILEALRSFTRILRSDLEKDARIFVMEMVQPKNYQCVLPIFPQYLRHQAVSELAYKKYHLLGKVIQHSTAHTETINLLSGTGLGSLSDEIMDPFLQVFQEMSNNGIQLPEIVTKIPAPSLQIIPIAIYV